MTRTLSMHIRIVSVFGGTLAVLTLPIHLLLPRPASELLAALVLAAIAGVHVGFAATHGSVARVVLQGVVCLGYDVLAGVALWTIWEL